ncbi:MAG: helix-turn-helix transcriptional regulator [Candidatus Thorarchaeota archaeon]
MTKPKIHVAILGNEKTIKHLIIRRSVDEIVLVFSKEKYEIAESLRKQLSKLNISVLPVCVIPSDFNNILSSILTSLDHGVLDEYQIEFSIASEYCTMTLAACVAAAIVKGSILCISGGGSYQIAEIWPSELVNLTHKKREILGYLENNKCPVFQKDISRDTGIRSSGVSRHIHDLELAGYIKRDRIARRKQVQITKLGSAILHYKQLRRRRVWRSFANRVSEGIQTVS